jgi:hypothetical protein
VNAAKRGKMYLNELGLRDGSVGEDELLGLAGKRIKRTPRNDSRVRIRWTLRMVIWNRVKFTWKLLNLYLAGNGIDKEYEDGGSLKEGICDWEL